MVRTSDRCGQRSGVAGEVRIVIVHMLSGLTGIVSGLVVVGGMFARKRMRKWVAVFLSATLAACVTGFYFLPVGGFTSAQCVGLFCSILLGMASYAFYIQELAGNWNQVYAVAVVEALFLNVLIAIAQSFQHFRFLKDLAPTQSSPIYVAVKLALLILFIAIGVLAAKRAGHA